MERLTHIIRASFRQPHAVVCVTTTADDIEGWDSLSHAMLLMNIEREFSIRFAPAEVLDLERVGDLLRIIERKVTHDKSA